MASNDEDPFASEEESVPEFSASEDEWDPAKEDVKRPVKIGRKGKLKVKAAPARPTRVSRRIATRLGKELPPEDEPEQDAVVVLPDEESASSSSGQEEEEKSPNRKKKQRGRRPAQKKGRKPKVVKDEPIKLTTFTVEELYRKYRPDLAGCSKRVAPVPRKVEVKKETEDDDSSGDDYLVDPGKLDLNSEFFQSVDVSVDKKEDPGIQFDCNVGLEMQESEEDEDEEKPLSSVRKEDECSTDFSKKLIQQINQSSQDCVNMIKLAEVSKRMENERKKLEQLRKEQEHKAGANEEDVSDLLVAGEKIKGKSSKQTGRNDFIAVDEKDNRVEEKTVEITLKFESAETGKKEKKKIDLLTAVKRLMNREKRQNQIYLHKVSILCWIGHGTYLNRTISNAALMELTIKRLLPSASCRPKGLTNLNYFQQVTHYFRKVVKLKNNDLYFRSSNLPPLQSTLKYQLKQRSAFSKRDYILLFLLMLRSLSIHCRLVISLVVPPKLVPTSELYRMNPKTNEELQAERRLMLDFRRAPRHSTVFKVREKLVELVNKNSQQVQREAARKRRREGFSATIPQLDGSHEHLFGSVPKELPRKKLKLMERSFIDIERNVIAKPSKKSSKEERKFSDDLDEEVRRRREKILAAYRASREQRELENARAKAEAEFLGEGTSSMHARPRGRLSAKEIARRKRPGVDLWIEVYCEHEDKWVTIDILSGKVHCLEDIVNTATHPMSYVLAWNNDGSMKDVSARYISRLGSKKSKLRVDDAWFDRTLQPYRVRRQTRRDRTEDLKFDKLLNKRPFPGQIGEYKNHPRFAIERHLLRNEAIYPRDAIVLGYIKDAPIYPRDCVHVLFSREGWLRQAKTVKLYEEPYKVVKAKAKYDRLTGTSITGLQTELFGTWQVQDYEPPVAQNGLVPRTAYGNVDLFKPCMLPKGTVHLQLPGLNKICKQLRIDCAQAITGFEYKNNACQAVYDGFVVCEEFRDQVIDEWYQEQVELERKEDEKRKKKVYSNWRRLVMGLFIRKKLKDRYNFDNL
ncbi:DNA repair protein complementing XP-C cells homolog [Ochlerotatus camptorhynchus]|uniref:DNA repair protein complementing XP-C cells homolog n=1 Tax=Ochlerotatus camptorhynchus TaxID=644619 RepID=UPI0031DC6F92